MSPKTIDRLVEAGLLVRYEFPECYDFPKCLQEVHYDFIRQAEVDELRKRWANGVPLDDVTRWLGLSKRTVLNLAQADLLFAEHEPDTDGSLHWVFSTQAVTECYCNVIKKLHQYRPNSATVNLDGAAQILSAIEWDETDILKCVASDKMLCYLPEGLQGTGNLLFTEGSICALLEEYKSEKGWVSHKEIARKMGVQDSSVARCVESGLLSPVVTCVSIFYLKQDAADQFVAEHVFINQAAKIAGVSMDTMIEWINEGLIEPVSGPKADPYHRDLFRREDVKRLRLQV